MKNVHNAVSDVMEELDMINDYNDIVEDEGNNIYTVTFQSKREQNNYCKLRVCILPNDLLVVTEHERVGMNRGFITMLIEEVEIAIDPDWV